VTTRFQLIVRNAALLMLVMIGVVSAGIAGNIRIIPSPGTALLDGSEYATIKRMPRGSEFVLTVNKGQDLSYFEMQWYKDGVAIEGETNQELRRAVATEELDGVYTISMKSPCATVMSKPTMVVVERRSHAVNTQYGTIHDDIRTAGPSFMLKGCEPNPVSERTMIKFYTPQESLISLSIVDLAGNTVATLVNEVLPQGEHDVTLTVQEHNLSAAAYFVVMNAPGFIETKPLMIIK
jgi:hypothetical protein